MKVQIEIPELIPGMNGKGGIRREHWRAYEKRRDRYQWTIKHQCNVRFKGPVKMTLIRYSKSEMKDYDNLVSCSKPVLDALTRAGIIEDDSMKVIGKPEYLQEKIGHKQRASYLIIIEQ